MMQEERSFNDGLVSRHIKKLMEENSVTKRHQVNLLSRILKLSFSHAYRKLKGESPWTLSQISEVARYFGENAGALIDISAFLDGEQKSLQAGLLILDAPKELPCLVRLAGPATQRNTSEYVACRSNDKWHIFPSDTTPVLSNPYLVECIEIRPKMNSVEIRIAVLDDEIDSADNLCEYLSAHGFQAKAFYTYCSFRQAYQENTTGFDAFVIDWWLGDETAERCIQELRKSGPAHMPIFLLTGELKTGKANETDINRVMRQYNITCVEKPVRMSLLIGNIEKELRMR